MSKEERTRWRERSWKTGRGVARNCSEVDIPANALAFDAEFFCTKQRG